MGLGVDFEAVMAIEAIKKRAMTQYRHRASVE
jgi:hypothetical protein